MQGYSARLLDGVIYICPETSSLHTALLFQGTSTYLGCSGVCDLTSQITLCPFITKKYKKNKKNIKTKTNKHKKVKKSTVTLVLSYFEKII